MGLSVYIKYHVDDLEKIQKINVGDWIDLRAAENVSLKKGEERVISLGVSMKLPKGFEAHVVPRSSTFKKWALSKLTTWGSSITLIAAIMIFGECRFMQ